MKLKKITICNLNVKHYGPEHESGYDYCEDDRYEEHEYSGKFWCDELN